MAVKGSLSVIVAYSIRASNSAELVPHMAPTQHAMWIEQMSLPIQELTHPAPPRRPCERSCKAHRPQRRCLGAACSQGAAKTRPYNRCRDASAFEREVRRRFHMGEESIIAYAAPTALKPEGRRATGFVARVEAGCKSCDLAIAGCKETAESKAIVAIARLILCDSVSTLTPPEIRVSAL